MNSYEEGKKHWERHVLSAVVTFATGFSLALLADIDSFTLEAVQNGAYLGLLFAAVRAGVKAVLEAFVAWRTSKLK